MNYLEQNHQRWEALLSERIKLKLRKEAAEQRIKELNEEIAAMMRTAEISEYVHGSYVVALVISLGRLHLDRTALLSAGVTEDQLESGSIRGKPFTTVQVSRLKEPK